jgi:hypothetical protein
MTLDGEPPRSIGRSKHVDGKGKERRIGKRVPGYGVRGSWVPMTGRLIGVGAVRLIDVSATGALIEAPISAKVVVGSQVRLELSGRHGSAVVRRIAKASTRGSCRYGVEFLTGDLRELVTELAQQRDALLRRRLDGTQTA